MPSLRAVAFLTVVTATACGRAPELPVVQANENRLSAGTLSGDELVVDSPVNVPDRNRQAIIAR